MKIKSIPTNFEELTFKELKTLYNNYNKTYKNDRKAIKNQAKKVLQKIKDQANTNAIDVLKQLNEVNKIKNMDYVDQDLELEFVNEYINQFKNKYYNRLVEITFTDGTKKLYYFKGDKFQDEFTYYGQNLASDMQDSNDNAVVKIIQSIRFLNNVYDPKNAKKYQYAEGFYLNYYCPSVDLRYLQIGRSIKEHEVLCKEHCFIYALRQAGVDEIKILNIRQQIVDLNKPLLKKNIEKFNLNIEIKGDHDQNHNANTIYQGEGDKIYMSIFKGHFIVDNENFDNIKCLRKLFNKGKLIEILKSNDFNKKEMKKQIIRVGDIDFRQQKEHEASEFKLIRSADIKGKIITWKNGDEVLNGDVQELINWFDDNLKKEKENGLCCLRDVSIIDSKKTDIETKNGKIVQFKVQLKNQRYIIFRDKDIQCESKFKLICGADFEAFTTNEEGKNMIHKPFLLMWKEINDEKVCYSEGDVQQLINWFDEKLDKKENGLCFFHNLSYDASFIVDKKNITLQDVVAINGKLVQFKIQLKNQRHIIFRDSVILFQAKLDDLTKMFNLENKKQVFPYKYYNEQRYKKNIGITDEAFGSKKQEFISSVKSYGDVIYKKVFPQNDQTFDMKMLAMAYCAADVRVLCEALKMFIQIIKDNFLMNITDYISISSFGLAYQQKKGCFDGVYAVSGTLRQYLSQFIVGGRCMLRNNEKQFVKKQYIKQIKRKNVGRRHVNKYKIKYNKVQDFDAVSLYPSAQASCGGYPKGPAMKMPKGLDWQKYDCYMEVKISKINKHRPFPLLAQRKDDGTLIFQNELQQDVYFLDTIALQDLIKFQQIEYEIIDGIYYKEINTNIVETIKEMFKLRIQYKETPGMESLQSVFKLMLNSSYGKTIEKFHYDKLVIKDKNEAQQYILNNLTRFDYADILENKYIIHMFNQVDDSYNFSQCGIKILSQSKRIMNEVINLADDNDINIYYQDTDSMHIDDSKVTLLCQLYKEKYGKVLEGKGMGQFHNDFEGGEAKSLRFIGCGKKCYLDVLDNGGYHIRMKGVGEQVVIKYCEDKEISLEELYEKIYNGEAIEFNLLSVGVKFKRINVGEVKCLDNFMRKIQF